MKELNTANTSWLFSKPQQTVKEIERGNENFRFYYKYVRQMIRKVMEARDETGKEIPN